MSENNDKALEEIKKEVWYEELIKNCLSIKSQISEDTKWEMIEMHHKIGKRIVRDKLNWEKPKYGEKILEKISGDLKMSLRSIYRSIQFVDKHPDFSQFKLEHKNENMSLHRLWNAILPQSRETREDNQRQPRQSRKSKIIQVLKDFAYSIGAQDISMTKIEEVANSIVKIK